MKVQVILALCVVTILPAVAAGAEPARVAAQELSVRIEPKTHEIEGTAVLHLDGAADAARALEFRIHAGLTVRVEAFRHGGEWVDAPVLDFGKPEGWWLTVKIEVPAGADAVRVRYRGTIYDRVQKAADLDFVVGDDTRGVIGEEGVFLVSGSGWYPVTGGVTVFRKITLDVPGDLRAVTQGGLASRTVAEGRERTVWTSDIAVDGLAMQAGDYVVDTRDVEGVKLSTYLFPRDRKHAKLFLDEAEKYVRFYTPLLGAYPWPKFDIVENFFTTGYGMPSYTLLGDDVIQVMVMMAARYGGAIPPGYIDHEMVHCWWGNYVYPDYETGNWCEGLTSYYSNYFRKEVEDAEKAAAHRQKISTTFSIRVTPENDYPVREFKGKTEDFENDIGYGKATMVFHALRRHVGDEVFFQTMRDIVRDFGGKKTSWADFEATYSKASGEDLSWFFAQWIGRKGSPSLSVGEVTATRNEDGAYVVSAEVLQDGEPWRLDVPVVVRHSGGESEQIVAVAGPKTTVTFEIPNPPRSVAIDPDFHVFRKVPLDEIQPCLNLTLSRPDKVYVVPEGDAAYARLAAMAAGGRGGKVVPAKDGLPEVDCVLFGRPEASPAVAKALAAAGVKVEGNAVTVKGRKHEGEDIWMLLSLPHPEAKGKFVTVFFGMTEKALRRARVIFHYGWDGHLVYQGRRPVSRGDFTTIRPRTEKALDLPEVGDRTEEVLRKLTDPALGGRRAGTEGGEKTREILSAALEAAGAARVRESLFGFTVRVWDDPDAWSVEQGKLGDGETRWITSFPGGVVPAIFSVDAPDGVRIRRIAKPGGDVGEGTLLMLPAPESVDALLTTLEGLAGSKVAAVGIPLSALGGKDRRMKDLVAWPARLAKDGDDGLIVAAGAQSRAPHPKVALSMPVVFLDERLLPPGGEGEANALLKVCFAEELIGSANVLAVVPDAAGRTDGPCVGISAHYDGLGKGHEGADDNASGVAALLEAVRILAARKDLLARPVRIYLFGAEEWGLRGSAAAVGEGVDDLTSLVNLDTVGAADVRQVYVVGRSHHAALAESAIAGLAAEGFAIGRDIDRFAFAYGSDHWPFHQAGVPAIDLYSGSYRRMNTKADVLSLVSPAKVTRIGRAAARMVLDLAARKKEQR